MHRITWLAPLFLLIAGSAQTKPLTSRSVTVTDAGRVSAGRIFLGTLTMPPPPRKLEVAKLTVQGQKILHIKVIGGEDKTAELVAIAPPLPRLIFAGSTGPQGVDQEWQQSLQVTSRGVLLYQGRQDANRCDGAQVYLFPRMYDFKTRTFRPVAHLPKVEGLTEVVATRSPAALPATEPLNTFRLVFASTHLGDGSQSINLAAPAEAEDGKPETAWFEGRGGFGQGEFIIARSEVSPYRLKALRLIPGHAKDRRTFQQANRIRSALLLLSAAKRFRISFPVDPAKDRGKLTDPYWIILPESVATTCATLVIEHVYPGSAARPPKDGGRTAISELRFFTELEFSGGLQQVAKDLASENADRGQAAVSILARQGIRGVQLAARSIPKATPRALGRILNILSGSGLPESAKPLVSLLPRLRPRQQLTALEALERLGSAAAPELLPLLGEGSSLELRASVARTLGRIGGDQVRTALLDLAGSGPVELRAAVVDGLTRLTPTDLEAVLQAAIASGRLTRKADLILAASRMGRKLDGRKSVARRIGELWATSTAFEVRYRILEALGRLDPAGQQSVLLRAVSTKDPVLRWLAVQQMRQINTRAAIQALQRAVTDSDPRVRAAAAHALAGRTADPRLGRKLAKQLLGERWSMVTSALAEALGRHCTRQGVDALKQTILSGPRGVDHIALISLARCRPPELFKELMAMAGSNTWRTSLRQRALQLISPDLARGHDDTLVRLFGRLRKQAIRSDGDEVVTLAAAKVLVACKTDKTAEALADALALDPHETIRAAAADALSEICSRRTTTTLKRAAKSDASPMVQRAARRALKRCGY